MSSENNNGPGKSKVIEFLKVIMDPEFEIDIFNLGLIYGVRIDDGKVTVEMTTTSFGCPTAPFIEDMVKNTLKSINGVREVEVEWTFDPPWSPEMMTDEGRELMESMGYL